MLVALSLCALAVGLFYIYLTWHFRYWQKRGVPGPPGYPVMGSFPNVFLQRTNLVYAVDEVYKKFRHDAPFVGIYTGRVPCLIVVDPAMVKNVYITNFKSFHDTEFSTLLDGKSDPLLSRNPFMLTGDEWKDKRGEVTQAFTHNRIKAMYPIMEHVSKKLTAYIHLIMKHKPNGIDAKDLGARFTSDVVSNCIYGIDSLALSTEHSVIREMGSSIFDFSFTMLCYLATIQIFPFLSGLLKLRVMPIKVEQFFLKLTRDAIQLRSNGTVKRDDFLNYLLQVREKKGMSDLDLAAHAMTFFVDGYETSSYVIANILNRLGANPAIQTRLRQEIEDVVGVGEEISFEKINDLQYLDQVFTETLRISPIVGFSARVCTENIELTDFKDKKVTIEKDTIVQVPVYSIHHDPEHYPNPKVFDPERFSPENGGVKVYKDKGVFLSFGEGPRICLGMRFGTLQVKVAIVEILRNFIVKVNAKTHAEPVYDPQNFLLSQLGGVWVDFVPIAK